MVDRLSEEELHLARNLADRLQHYVLKNQKKEKQYDGSHIPQTYGIALPPKMSRLKAVLGWPSICVDTLEERLDFFGFNDPFDLGLDEIFTANSLDAESPIVHHDSLLYGSGFAVVGTGSAGEPEQLITMESPSNITSIFNKRTRRTAAAFGFDADTAEAELYLPGQTIYMLAEKGTFTVLHRDQHQLGRVPVVHFPNRVRSGHNGQSEISEAVEYLTDAAARTAIRMEVASEFYSAPKEVILGGDRDLLLDADGNPISQWSSYLGRTRQIPWNDDEESKTNPQITQLDPADPNPFISQIDMFGSQLAAQSGFPVSYLGITTNMATSADGIAAGEVRLVKRAERRQKLLGRSWREVGYLSLLIRDGEVPDEYHQVSTNWMDASTPTKAATTDATVKLVSAGILPKDSPVVYDTLNLSAAQRQQLQADNLRARSSEMLSALRRPDTSQEG